MPDHALIKHTVNTGNVKSSYKPIYNLLVNELSILRDNLEKLLKKGYIQRLTNLAGTSILFILKKNGSLRIYINYRGLNKVTKKKWIFTSFYKRNARSTLRNNNIYEAGY